MEDREKAVAAREQNLQARETICDTKDEEAKETQRRVNLAAESLRGQWERLREEKEKYKDVAGFGLPEPIEEIRELTH